MAQLPPGLKPDEAQALVIREGLAGRAAVRSGDCTPGCGPRDCRIEPPGVRLWAIPVEADFFERPAGAAACMSLQQPTPEGFEAAALEPQVSGR